VSERPDQRPDQRRTEVDRSGQAPDVRSGQAPDVRSGQAPDDWSGQAPDDWFEQVPKVELHLHLEGAIPLPALWEIIQQHGGDSAVPDRRALRQRFAYRGFAHFIETWIWKNNYLRTYDDFTFAAEAVAARLAAQNIRYAEVFYSPPDFRKHGLETGRLTEAIRRGLRRVEEKGEGEPIAVSLVADLVRDDGPRLARRTLREVAEVASLGVVGIGIGGTEPDFPPEPFAAVFEEARRLGFATSAHAGEAAGPASVRGAVERLRVDRVGHGTRAAEDPALVRRLGELRVTLETCPLSNLRTGVVRSLGDHPVRLFFERGLSVTVSTDDPVMFGNSLAAEYRALEAELGFTRDELCAVILESARAAWLSPERRAALEAELVAHPAWSRDGAPSSGSP
jgi:adenosine deaminase